MHAAFPYAATGGMVDLLFPYMLFAPILLLEVWWISSQACCLPLCCYWRYGGPSLPMHATCPCAATGVMVDLFPSMLLAPLLLLEVWWTFSSHACCLPLCCYWRYGRPSLPMHAACTCAATRGMVDLLFPCMLLAPVLLLEVW